ncbi:hypothetical protein H4R33_005076 [Dimargaris cristalligena]|nr:hypothetical protein H4R33_005076 [Dimargaris cristalligena]
MGPTKETLPSLVIVQDAVDRSFYYPNVHYVFADDPEPDPFAESVTAIDLYLNHDGDGVERFRSSSSHFQPTECEFPAQLATDPTNEGGSAEQPAPPLSPTVSGGVGGGPPPSGRREAATAPQRALTNGSLDPARSLAHFQAARRTPAGERTLLVRGIFAEETPRRGPSMVTEAGPIDPSEAGLSASPGQMDLADTLANLDEMATRLVNR